MQIITITNFLGLQTEKGDALRRIFYFNKRNWDNQTIVSLQETVKKLELHVQEKNGLVQNSFRIPMVENGIQLDGTFNFWIFSIPQA